MTGELSGSRSKWFHSTVPRIFNDTQSPDVARVHEAAEAVAEGAVRAFEQSRLTGVRRVAGSVHRRLSIVVHERHLECWVTWVNLE